MLSEAHGCKWGLVASTVPQRLLSLPPSLCTRVHPWPQLFQLLHYRPAFRLLRRWAASIEQTPLATYFSFGDLVSMIVHLPSNLERHYFTKVSALSTHHRNLSASVDQTSRHEFLKNPPLHPVNYALRVDELIHINSWSNDPPPHYYRLFYLPLPIDVHPFRIFGEIRD